MSDENISETVLNQDLYLESTLNSSININNYCEQINRIGLIYMATTNFVPLPNPKPAKS